MTFESEWHILLALSHFTGIDGPHLSTIVDQGGGLVIVELLKRYYDCYELQLVGLHALYGLAAGGDEAVRTLAEAGAAQSIVTIVGANRDKPQILASACDVLARFARNAPLILVEQGVHVVVAQALRSRKDNYRLIAAALSALVGIISAEGSG